MHLATWGETFLLGGWEEQSWLHIQHLNGTLSSRFGTSHSRTNPSWRESWASLLVAGVNHQFEQLIPFWALKIKDLSETVWNPPSLYLAHLSPSIQDPPYSGKRLPWNRLLRLYRFWRRVPQSPQLTGPKQNNFLLQWLLVARRLPMTQLWLQIRSPKPSAHLKATHKLQDRRKQDPHLLLRLLFSTKNLKCCHSVSSLQVDGRLHQQAGNTKCFLPTNHRHL